MGNSRQNPAPQSTQHGASVLATDTLVHSLSVAMRILGVSSLLIEQMVADGRITIRRFTPGGRRYVKASDLPKIVEAMRVDPPKNAPAKASSRAKR